MSANTKQNGQLDIGEFAAIVSHDCRAPIRHISQFTSILLDSIEHLNEDQQRCMQHIQSSIQKSNAMMDGLRQLAQIGSSSQPPGAVDFAAAFEQSLQKTQAVYAIEPTTTLAIDSNCSAIMQSGHLQQLLGALLDNSFKFHPNPQQLALKFEISALNDNVRIALSDNGPGIPENFREQAVMVFKQLSGQSAGIGIGLTHACYIANYYGGKLSVAHHDANDADQTGTTVEIVLPTGVQCQVA